MICGQRRLWEYTVSSILVGLVRDDFFDGQLDSLAPFLNHFILFPLEAGVKGKEDTFFVLLAAIGFVQDRIFNLFADLDVSKNMAVDRLSIFLQSRDPTLGVANLPVDRINHLHLCLPIDALLIEDFPVSTRMNIEKQRWQAPFDQSFKADIERLTDGLLSSIYFV